MHWCGTRLDYIVNTINNNNNIIVIIISKYRPINISHWWVHRVLGKNVKLLTPLTWFFSAGSCLPPRWRTTLSKLSLKPSLTSKYVCAAWFAKSIFFYSYCTGRKSFLFAHAVSKVFRWFLFKDRRSGSHFAQQGRIIYYICAPPIEISILYR